MQRILKYIISENTTPVTILDFLKKEGFSRHILSSMNRFYLVMYKWKSYLKWSKGDVGQFIFSSLCSCICHTDSPFQ